MRTLRFALPVAASMTLFGASAHATVSAVTITTASVARQDSSGNLYECPGRNSSSNADGGTGCIVDGKYQGVGFRDCTDDTQLSIPIQITGLPDNTVNLQVWAGTGDCTQQGQTNNGSTGVCWQVAPPSSALTNPMTIKIRVEDLINQLGVSPPVQTWPLTPASTPTVCSNSAGSTTTTTTDDSGAVVSSVGESTINIYFLFFSNQSTGTPVVASAAYPVKVKLTGPSACTNVTAGAGDGLMLVTWTPPTNDTTIQGFNLYSAPVGSGGSEGGTITICSDASQGTELLDDSGIPVLDDAGNPIFVDDAGNPVNQDAGCYQQIVPPGTNSCVNGSGTMDTSTANVTQINGITNAKGTIQGLTNGVSYDVAVAAFDQFGNSGTLSNVVCASPAPIDDFWKTYNQDGGVGFCALEVVGKRGGGVVAAFVSIAALIFMRRRRK